MSKLQAFWKLFQAGYAISDARLWKHRQISTTALAATLLGIINLAAAFGYSIPIDADTANAIAAGFLALFNTAMTVITTDKVGFKADEPVLENKPEVKHEEPASHPKSKPHPTPVPDPVNNDTYDWMRN